MNNPLLAVVVNHLWQSTLVLLVVGCTAMVLRRSDARVRYWLWFAASMKFLVPFALLAAIGAQIPWQPATGEPGTEAPRIVALAKDFAAPMAGEIPFVQPVWQADDTLTMQGDWSLLATLATALALLVWVLGAIIVAARWLVRWLEIRRTLRRSAALADIDFPAPVRATETQFEPGVVGIFRPALLLPTGMESRLTREQLQAVLAHERCHLRRRDNLTASLHMLVEAMFWFYPPVWWLGARLIEERERACDEQVVRDGHARESYAEGILAVCEHYIASRLPCVSGVSGSDLPTRIHRILKGTVTVKLDGPKKLILAAVSCCAVAAPIAAGAISGSMAQVLFSLDRSTVTMLEYWQFRNASLEHSMAGMADFRAPTCPAPDSTLVHRQKALAARVEELSPADGEKVLLYAVAANSAADVQRLLAGGASRTGDGFVLENSLMHIAARFGDVQMLGVLKDAGLGIDDWQGTLGREGNGTSSRTPLMVAIESGRRDNVDWFIEHGADVSATNQAGNTVLVYAMIHCGDQELVTQLVQAGALPNDKTRRIATTMEFDLH